MHWILVLFSAAGLTAAAPLPLSDVALSKHSIVFSYGGSLWSVERSGGEARKLAAGRTPVFSPDGSQIALTRGGDIYVMPAAGGEAKRLTWHPKADAPVGWTPDGTAVLFYSARESDGYTRLYTIGRNEALEKVVALPRARHGALSPDGKRIAYTPLSTTRTFWRHYRGGRTAQIRIANLSTGVEELIPSAGANDWAPHWQGDSIYFLSDRTGDVNVFSFHVASKKLKQWTRFSGQDAVAFSVDEGAIAAVQDGAIHLTPLTGGTTHKVELRVPVPDVAKRNAPAAAQLSYVDPSPAGDRILFTARGELLLFDIEKDSAANLTQTPSIAERDGIFSPDGKSVAYFSDESGEYMLHVRPLGGGAVQKISIEPNPSFYSWPVWSPDGRYIVFQDKRLALWLADVASGKTRRLDSSSYAGQAEFQSAWSGDGKWLAYTKCLANRVRTLFLYSVDKGVSTQVTSGRDHASNPAFDKGGQYLYFYTSPNAGPAETFGLFQVVFYPQVGRYLNVAVLSPGGRSPFAPPAEGPPAPNQAEGIADRLIRLPLPPRDYVALLAPKPGVLFLIEREWKGMEQSRSLHRLELAKRRPEKWLDAVRGCGDSANGEYLFCSTTSGGVRASTSTAPKPGENPLPFSKLKVDVDPRAEWKQIFQEAIRLQRDYFYDANLHGQKLKELAGAYEKYLPQLSSRQDLNSLLQRMFSHLAISHMAIGGGDEPAEPQPNVGLLGADYAIDSGRYRFARVLRGDNESQLTTSPLTQPGMQARPGEYLLQVDGVEVKADVNVDSYFVNKAGRTTRIRVGPKPDGDQSRELVVTPLAGENGLRESVRLRENRRRVEEASAGRIGYIYLPDTGRSGYEAFLRDFYANVDKQGLIIDERYNGGGFPADFFVESLTRRQLSAYAFREGDDLPFPAAVIPGPRVMIINESAGSGGDTLPWMFRRAGAGTLVGTRTAGAGIGGFVNMPSLVDGGRVLAPNRAFFDPVSGALDIENHGVKPDIEADLDPVAWRSGKDSQLEKAIEIALGQLKRKAPVPARHSDWPVYR